MKKIELSDSALLTAYDLIGVLCQVASTETMNLIEEAAAKTEQELRAALESRGYHLVCQHKGEVGL